MKISANERLHTIAIMAAALWASMRNDDVENAKNYSYAVKVAEEIFDEAAKNYLHED